MNRPGYGEAAYFVEAVGLDKIKIGKVIYELKNNRRHFPSGDHWRDYQRAQCSGDSGAEGAENATRGTLIKSLSRFKP